MPKILKKPAKRAGIRVHWTQDQMRQWRARRYRPRPNSVLARPLEMERLSRLAEAVADGRVQTLDAGLASRVLATFQRRPYLSATASVALSSLAYLAYSVATRSDEAGLVPILAQNGGNMVMATAGSLAGALIAPLSAITGFQTVPRFASAVAARAGRAWNHYVEQPAREFFRTNETIHGATPYSLTMAAGPLAIEEPPQQAVQPYRPPRQEIMDFDLPDLAPQVPRGALDQGLYDQYGRMTMEAAIQLFGADGATAMLYAGQIRPN